MITPYVNPVNQVAGIYDPEPGYDYPDTTLYPGTGFAEDYYKDRSASDLANGINEDNWLKDLQDRANRGDTSAYEKLINYFASEQSAKTARDWTSEREDTQYQRLIEDLRKAGISPYVLSGATPGVSSSTGRSYSGSEIVSSENNKRTTTANNIRAMLAMLGLILGASIRAAAIAA